MQVKVVTEKEKNAFNKAAGHPLQSWEWGGFREKAGNEVVRLGVYQGNKLTDAIQIVFSKIPKIGFKIGTVIKGPIPTKEILNALKDLAKEENAIFIKLEPNVPVSVDSRQWTVNSKKTEHRTPNTEHPHGQTVKLLTENNCVPGKTLFTPTSFWVDLTKSEDELLKSFTSKTRYNIHLAQRKGVEVAEDNSDMAFDKYIKLTRETVERQGFYSHTEKYHHLMWQTLHKGMIESKKEPTARLLVARYKGQIITTWILIAWHQFLYYPYGASSSNSEYKPLMANNLIMWEAIRYGKKLGLTTFDLWGREEGKGFTKFKEGYNPKVVEFLGTWDLITSPLYWPYRIVEFTRWQILRTKSKFIKPTF